MENILKKYLISALLLPAGLFLSAPESGHAQDIAAVLSSESASYRQALEGFYDVTGRAAPVTTLTKDAPNFDGTVKAAVLFGARASLAEYPQRIARVYCMAPGLPWSGAGGRRTEAFVQMMPAPQALLSKLKEIQPAMRKLAIFWISPSIGSYCDGLREAAAGLDIELLLRQLETAGGLPEALRGLPELPDAIWLPPDPALVTASTFATLRDFSVSNKTAFYVPTDGLVEKGALASVSIDFREVGRAAAKAAGQLLAGKQPDNPLYPEKIEVTLNSSAAKKIGFVFREETIKRADKVLP